MEMNSTQLVLEKDDPAVAFRTSEEERMLIMQSATDAIICNDRDGKITFWNPRAELIFGRSEAEVLGKNLCDLIIAEEFKADFNFTAMTSPPLNTLREISARRSTGNEFPIEISVIRLRRRDQDFFCTFIRDITEQKLSRALLVNSEKKYRSLFNHSPAAIIIWTPTTGKILKVNAAAEQDYGYLAAELLTMTIHDLKKPHNCCVTCSNTPLHPKEDGASYTGSRDQVSKTGKLIRMEFTSHPIMFKGERAVFSLGVNITEKYNLERKLRIEKIRQAKKVTQAVITAQEKEREEIGRELHDNVNQILATARLYLGLAKKKLVNKNKYAEQTDALIKNAIEELRGISHSLILPSLKKEDFMKSLDDILNAAKAGSDFAIEKEISIPQENRIPENLWLTVFRIIQEQFSNILKYAAPTTVWFGLNFNGKELLLNIKDDGCGFDPAKNADGVGLLNIKTRASLNNGSAVIQSSPGTGCLLSVVFKID